MSAKLQSLIVTYCSSLPADVQALAQTLAPAAEGADAVLGNLAGALDRVHRVKGAGGSLGFAAVSRAAADLEARLRALDTTMGADDGVGFGAMLQSLAQLEELATTIKPEGSSLYGIDLSHIAPPVREVARKS